MRCTDCAGSIIAHERCSALAVPSQATTVIIDSIDTLLEDRESLSEAYKTLARVCEAVKKHPGTRPPRPPRPPPDRPA